ncbi:transcriptional regulator, TetR family [Alkaliphilus metalliredigens QYMF]|uniref:Transcriptional regulator, TetR family n=1 Tax=Alkaliphilus metalliredigens (strain QYMF) TaxID=293826 RepID=A6TUV7_ALKMQ|nr:TetR/AcrR family transcriptional regulator [Alkaliphilus metalliredigens]ABR49975.1 transcriptional regulator, TetR family [Alkaliphilus metalliredigens QYMF]
MMPIDTKEKDMENILIQKSLEIFSIKGYAATNLTDITNALGISRGPIYYHFKDKFGLYKAAFNYYEIDLRQTHAKIIAQDLHIISFIEAVIYDCGKRHTKYGLNFFFGIDTIEELSPIKKLQNNLIEDIYQQKMDYVIRLIEKGEIRRTTDPKQIVDLIYLVYFGLFNAIQVNMLKDYSEREIKNLIRVLLSGIEKYYCD